MNALTQPSFLTPIFSNSGVTHSYRTECRYANVLAKGVYNAGVGKGHEDHYVESHELANKPLGKFQRRVICL